MFRTLKREEIRRELEEGGFLARAKEALAA
jgi:hypothetical protein